MSLGRITEHSASLREDPRTESDGAAWAGWHAANRERRAALSRAPGPGALACGSPRDFAITTQTLLPVTSVPMQRYIVSRSGY